MNLPLLPTAHQVLSDPSRYLDLVVAKNRDGTTRHYTDTSSLAEALTCGEVTISDFMLPFRPPVNTEDAARLLPEEASDCIESDDHRLLKTHARVAALALNRDAQLVPEQSLSRVHLAPRADLISRDSYGMTTTYECGATDGRTILRHIDDGAVRVFVLPFAGLSLTGAVRGYVFSQSGASVLPQLTYEDGRSAFGELLTRIWSRNILRQPIPMAA